MSIKKMFSSIKKRTHKKAIALLAISFVMAMSAGCQLLPGVNPEDPAGSSSSAPGTTPDYSQDGNYYVSAIGEDYTLSMSEGMFSLTMGDEFKMGVYVFEDDTFEFVFTDKTTASATVADGVIALSYNNTTYNFVKKVEFTLSYSVDGDVVKSVKVINGKTVEAPAEPVKEGYLFIGWYLDEAGKTPFTHGATPVTADTTLYAKFVEKVVGREEFKVTLVVDGEVHSTLTTVNGVVPSLPSIEKEDATFLGWWMSVEDDPEKLTAQYMGQTLNENTRLFAVWENDELLVSVTENGVKWNSLGVGVNYTVNVYINGELLRTEKTTGMAYEFDFTARGAAAYTVEVSGNGKSKTAYFNYKTLAKVSNFTVAEPSVLIFNAVENAEKYLITIDCGNDEHVHEELDNGSFTYFNFSNCDMQEGGIKFTVKAVANGYLTSVSETFSFERNLDALTGLSYDSGTGTLQWNPVERATAYVVEVTKDGVTDKYTVNGKSFSMRNYSGEISVKVSATAVGYNSSSATLSYTSVKMQAPTNVSVSNNTISWTGVAGATKYNVIIDGVKVGETEAMSMDIPEEYRSVGLNFEVAVQAVGETDAQTSFYSDSVRVNYGLLKDVTYKNGALTWAPVGGAAKYEYTLNGGPAHTVVASATSTKVKFRQAGKNVIVLTAKDSQGNILGVSQEVSVSSYEFVLESRSESGSVTQYLAVGDEIDFTFPVELAKSGYTFDAWYNVPGGAEVNGRKFEDKTYSLNTPYTVYACWTPNEYEAKLVTGEDTFEMVTLKYDSNYTLPVPTSEISGVVFAGWNTQADGNGVYFTDELGRSVAPWKDAETRTLYPIWTQALTARKTAAGDGFAVMMAPGLKEKALKEITIPATFTLDGETLPVVAIPAEAFYNCKDLVTINIPDTIQTVYIGEGGANSTGSAFFGCSSLKNINVYETEGRHETFFSSVDGVLIRHAQPNVPMENGTELYYFPAAREGIYQVPDCVQFIPQKTFQKAKITDIIIPSSVALIGRQAFERSALVSVVFTEGANAEPLTLDVGVFAYCYSLTSVDLPARLVETAFNEMTIFDSCTSLSEINVVGVGGVYTSNDGMICDATGRQIIYCPIGRAGEVIIPVSVQGIAEGAFRNCKKITSLVVGANVAEIGKEAFMGCKGITTVEFRGQAGDMTICEKAFYGCTSLRELELSENVTKIEAKAFGNTPLNKTVTLNAGANIDYATGAFMDDDGKGYVTKVIIGENMGSFEIKGVFSGCMITDVSVQGSNANYSADENGVLYNSDKTQLLFYPKKLIANFKIPATVTTISAGVFEGNNDITTLEIGKNVTTIGAYAFRNMPMLTSITFEAGRTEPLTIGDSAFEGCSKLTLELPETLTSIGAYAFKNCTSIKTLTLPASLMKLGNDEEAGVFDGCTGLESIQVAQGSEAFESQGGILYGRTDGAATALYFVPANYKGDVVIPKTVHTIPERAFYGHTGITSVVFEDNEAPVNVRIGAYAFAAMTSVTKVILPANLTVIPEGLFETSNVAEVFVPNTVNTIELRAFLKASKLNTLTFEEGNEDNILVFEDAGWTAFNNAPSKGLLNGAPLATSGLVLPNRVKRIPDFYFEQCAFTKLVLPASLEYIGIGAFNKCTSMKQLEFAKNEDGSRANLTLGHTAFNACTALTSLTVPSSIKKYEGVGSDTTISGVVSTKLKLHKGFGGLTGLTSLTFEDGVTEIPSGLFYGCNNTNLATVVIPDSVTVIGEAAFAACKLKNGITIGSGVKEIGNFAFYNCYTNATTGLLAINIPANVETIGNYAFASCKALKTLTFDANSKLSKIGKSAFDTCSALVSVELPYNENIAELQLGVNVFNKCTALTSAIIPTNVMKLNGAFAGCTKVVITYAGAAGEDNGSGFVLTDNGKRLLKYTGTAEEVVIPDTVEIIGENAFTGNTTMKKLTISNSVKVIEWYAFQQCSALKEVVVGEFSKLISVGNYAFSESGIESIALPTITELGNYAFYKCASLTSVTLNDDLAVIGDYVFSNCTALEGITLPSQLTTLGLRAFEASGLKSIVLPELLVCTDMAQGYWFFNCKSFVSVEIQSTNLGIIPTYAFSQTAIESIVIPEGVTTIADAFPNAKSLKTISFPTTLTTLNGVGTTANVFGYTAIETLDFSKTALTTLDGPYSIYGSGNVLTFATMNSLKTLILPETITYLDKGHLQTSTAIETFIAPGLTVVNAELLYNRANLKTVEFSPELNTIGNYAFYGCTSLTQFNFTDGIKSIGYAAFYQTGLTSLDFGTQLETIGEYAFSGTPVLEVNVPAMLTSIGNYAFAYCPNFTAFHVSSSNPKYYEGAANELYDNTDTLVFFPAAASGDNGVVTIAPGVSLGEYAFAACTNITEVVLPEGLYEIPAGAFENSSISRITIPESVTIIGNNAFAGCTKLETLTIPASVNTIGTGVFTGKFVVNENNQSYHSGENGELFAADGTYLYVPNTYAGVDGVVTMKAGEKLSAGIFSGKTGIKEVILPSDLTTIPANAFANSGITTITIPATVTSIDATAFTGCTALETLIFADGRTSGLTLAKGMFKNFTGLKTVTMGDGITGIGDEVFYGCSSLTSVTLSSSLTSIGKYAFRGCTSLKTITIPYSVTTIGQYAFYQWDKTQTINVVGRSKKATGWNSSWFTNKSSSNKVNIVWNYVAPAPEVGGDVAEA